MVSFTLKIWLKHSFSWENMFLDSIWPRKFWLSWLILMVGVITLCALLLYSFFACLEIYFYLIYSCNIYINYCPSFYIYIFLITHTYTSCDPCLICSKVLIFLVFTHNFLCSYTTKASIQFFLLLFFSNQGTYVQILEIRSYIGDKW